jgi:uncharacterized protein
VPGPDDETPPVPAAVPAPEAGIDPRLLELLVCPLTKGPLRLDAARGELVSEQAGLAYPIRDGIPIMLADEARPLDDEHDRVPPEVRADGDR